MAKNDVWRRRFGWSSIAFIFLAWLAYFGIYRFDHQNANIGFALNLILAGLLGLAWFLLQTAISIPVRVLTLIFPLIGVSWFFQNYEFRGFSGEMVPQFRAREPSPHPKSFSKITSRNGESISKQSAIENLPDDFPFFRQFLGNDRNGVVSDIKLSNEWNAEEPRILWKRPIGRGWSGFAIQNGFAITMEEFDGRDCIVALNWNDGSLRWRSPLERRHYDPRDGGGPSATPTIDGERFYAQSSTGIVCCGELASGNLVWKVDLLEKAGITQTESETGVTWGRSGSPLRYRDLVVVPFGGAAGRSPAGLIALDRTNGDERWRGSKTQISYASPTVMSIQGVDQIVIVNESTVTGHEPETGKELWSHDWPGSSNGGATVSQAVAIDSSRVFISKGYGGGAEMLGFSQNASSNLVVESRWKNASLLKTKFTSAIYKAGYLYGLSDGILECVDADTGKRMWKDSKNGRLGHGQLLIVGDHLVVSSEDGRIVVGSASPKSFQKVGEVSVLTGITWNTIAIAGNRILMRNGEQAACIEMPIEGVPRPTIVTE